MKDTAKPARDAPAEEGQAELADRKPAAGGIAPMLVVVDPDADHAELLRRLVGPPATPPVRVLPLDRATLLFEHIERGELDAAEVDAVLVGLHGAGDEAGAVCRRLRAEPAWRDVPLLLLAADAESEALREGVEAGATDFLRLPFGLAEARLRLRAALQLRDALRQARLREAEVAAARDELQRSLDQLRADLAAARRVQRGLLPPADPALPGLRAGWCFRPCDDIGGDLFGIEPLPDGRVALYMLDVAGHGVPAALFAVSLHRLLSARLEGALLLDEAGRARAPAEVVQRLARLFEPQGGPIAYFTLLLALLDPRDGELQWCRAGHPPLLLAEPGAPVQVLADGDPPVGLLPSVAYRTQRRRLEPGTRLVLVTDAALETESPAHAGEPFGLERLRDAVEAGRGLAPADAAAGLEATVRGWGAPAPAADDLSLLVVDVQGPSAR